MNESTTALTKQFTGCATMDPSSNYLKHFLFKDSLCSLLSQTQVD
jgi:hypothetical protein